MIRLLKLSIVKQGRNQSHRLFFEDENRWVINYGGAGSAKSYSTGQKILVDRIMQEANHRYLITRKVAKTLRVSVFQLFKDLISDINSHEDFKINKSDMTITYIPNNSMLMFFGLDDIEKLKSIQGITGIWCEEASEMDKGDILELNRRLRGITPYYKQFILTFNPISHLHWLKEHFFDNPQNKASIYKTTYLDNSFIDEEYKQELEDIKHYDFQQYRIYALGEWGVLNNNIIHHRYDYEKHVSDKTIDDFHELHIGIDFNISACACTVLGEDTQGIAHFVDEFIAYDTEEIIVELKNRYSNKEITLYPDASGANRSTSSRETDVDMLRQAGFYCNVPDGNGAVATRYNAFNRKFMMNEILVNQITCPRINESLQTHAYDDAGKPEKFNIHSGGACDDWTDSSGYIVIRLYPIVVPFTQSKITGF